MSTVEQISLGVCLAILAIIIFELISSMIKKSISNELKRLSNIDMLGRRVKFYDVRNNEWCKGTIIDFDLFLGDPVVSYCHGTACPDWGRVRFIEGGEDDK